MVYLIVFIFTLRRRELLKWNSMEFICIVSIFMLSILALQVLSSLLLYKVTAKEEVFSLVPFPDGSVYELTPTSTRVLTDRKGSVYSVVEIDKHFNVSIEDGDKSQLVVVHEYLRPTALSKILWCNNFIQLFVKTKHYKIVVKK